jgi:hypothetical protein
MNTSGKQTKKTIKTTKQAKKAKPWSTQHDKLYTRLYNLYIKAGHNADKENYIITERRDLLGFIDNLQQSNSSKKALMFMVGRYLELHNDRYYEIYLKRGSELMKEVNEEEQNNQQTEREILNYKPLNYYLNLLNEIENKSSYQYMLLAMLTLQPPVRSSFYNSAYFIFKKEEDDKENNFIYYNNSTKKMFYIVNNDKVKNTKQYANNKNTYIEIENTQLKDIILKSYVDSPRDYVFENENGDAYTYETLLRWLRAITRLPGVSINMFRSAHVNELYHKSSTTTNDKKKLALQMRHSMGAAESFYYKTLPEQTLNGECDDIKQQLDITKNDLQQCQDKKEDDKAYNKKRYDVVYRLNKYGKTPLKSSIDKYNLIFKGGKWE